MPSSREDSIIGCLTGLAVGDALGLPSEGLSPRRALRLFPKSDRYRFLFGWGMFSDDTEHACMTAQSLLVSGGHPERFAANLASRLRWWLLGLPLSMGRATLKACIRLWLGFPAKSSGVWSAGNGPAMRSPIIGVCFGDLPERLRELVRRSTRITHSDPKAEWGALAIARAAYLAFETKALPIRPPGIAEFIAEGLTADAEKLIALVRDAAQSAESGESTLEFAGKMGLSKGVTGYMFHTVPIALHAWMRFPDDYMAAVQSAIACGGDTDTTAAITGALAGARLGKESVPNSLRGGLCEWPRNLHWIERLGRKLAQGVEAGTPQKGVPLNVFGILARNLLFNITVMGHVFRRMLPPF